MGNRKSVLITAAVLSIGVFWLPPVVLAETQGTNQAIKLDGKQARRTAWRALHLGKPQVTLRIASALAQQTPDDFELIFLQAQALHALGHNTASATAARHAYRSAQNKEERFDAAHMVAKAHFAKGANTRAQFWLRRATQIAPNERAGQMTKRDFQFIQQHKPLATRAFFNAFPTSNINNGSVNSDIEGTDFSTPPSARPHSGTGFTAGFETTYSRRVSERTQLRFGVFALGTAYKLSTKAKAIGSGKTGADFAFATVETRFGLTHLPAEFAQQGWGRLKLDAALGYSLYGGDPLSVHYRLDATKDYHFSRSLVGDFGVGVSVQNRLDSANASSKSGQIEIGLTRKISNTQRLRFGLTVQQSNSDSNLVQYSSLGAELRYSLPAVGWDVRPTVKFAYQRKDFPNLSIGGIQRQDDQISASLSLFFPKASYYGFAPNLNLSANHNKSSVSIFSTRDLRISLGFNSTF